MLLSCLPLDASEGIGLLTWDWRTGAEEPWSCGEPRNISALAPPSFDPVFGFCTFERGRSKVRVLGAKRVCCQQLAEIPSSSAGHHFDLC